MLQMIRGFAALFALVAVGTVAADDKNKPKADPKGTPLELSITGKKVKYTLDTGTLTPEEYKKAIEGAADPIRRGPGGRVRPGGRVKPLPGVGGGNEEVPPPPEVNLTVSLKNTSGKPVQVWVSGDPVVLTLDLQGKGAVNVAPRLAFTQEFRLPQAVELAPGKSHEFPVKALMSGHRGASRYSYWTAPGEYELVATLKTGMRPAPKGAQDFDGFGVVTLTSAPLKITVEGKK